MNSKQRRNLTRKLKYQITIPIVGESYYYEFDEKIINCITWCKKKATGFYSIDTQYAAHAIFHFEKERDAIVFALKYQ
jgi:hypothetical protein